ncbi:NifU family protein [Alicyclobacillus tolerans]|uniref:Fe-S cluster biogenesis protein NfuA n=2 Tax=Alicyclobacillus tolerans TaxID=90970 RepID=A0ABT9LTL7_9BACL|nr:MULTISPECIES: NifU family protein [Alicyclobacillus]MDP9727607.1 Fe-S cluster biogenesis protein NfuA [Alicyclobacillus tengchongensis]QRF24034.1 NifU family protein [Alicyclobacillus sp. TC]SHJ64674.1 Fe-S cluster biogenesis protein NfuA, 4Fe-4S-binding domain [Alicyclobacillus montanus]
MDVENRIREVLVPIKEAIQQDGGDVEFVSYDSLTKTVYVSLLGACVGCPASMMTLKMGVERSIRQQIPEVEHVEAC